MKQLMGECDIAGASACSPETGIIDGISFDDDIS